MESEGDGMMNFRNAALLATLSALLSACSVGVKRTEGMKAYSAGDFATAIPKLQAEVANGEVSARYSLGLAYRDGNGVAKDSAQAEILLTGAAIGGDPRAVADIREMLRTENRCPADKQLHNLWGSLALHRNMVYGTYELNTAPPRTLVAMADIYDKPCAGRPAQPEAARSLRSLAGGPRYMWIYVPG